MMAADALISNLTFFKEVYIFINHIFPNHDDVPTRIPLAVKHRNSQLGKPKKKTRRTCAQGSKIAVVGANGCGKSTLLSYLSGREKPKEGEIRLQLG